MGRWLAVPQVGITLLPKKETKIHRSGSSRRGAASSLRRGCLQAYFNVLLKIALSIQTEAMCLGLSRAGFLPAEDRTKQEDKWCSGLSPQWALALERRL